jgi:toxin CptA
MVVGQPGHLRRQGLQVVLVQRVAISPSVRLAVALCLLHGAAGALLWLVPIPTLAKAVFTLAIAISLIYFLARDATLHAAQAIVALELDDGGSVLFQTRDGRRVECELLGSSYVSPRLSIVSLRPWGRLGTRRVVLVEDNVGPQDFRRLRTWLRWKRGEPEDLGAALDR